MYRIGEFAARVGRSASTVRRWEREGRLTAKRTTSGQRYFDESDVRAVLQLGSPDAGRVTVVYCRVSSPGQKDDLAAQVSAMEVFCLNAGIAVDQWITEVGDGMNFKRKKFVQLIDQIADGRVEQLVLAHKDRLTRFGFDLIDHIAERNGCTVTVANTAALSPQQELVDDLLAIVHTFSYRISGLRRYERQIANDRDLTAGGGW